MSVFKNGHDCDCFFSSTSGLGAVCICKSVLFFYATLVLDFLLFFSERWSGIVPTKNESLGQSSVNCCGRGICRSESDTACQASGFLLFYKPLMRGQPVLTSDGVPLMNTHA